MSYDRYEALVRADFFPRHSEEPDRRATGHQNGMRRDELRRAVLKSRFRDLLLRVEQNEMTVLRHIG